MENPSARWSPRLVQGLVRWRYVTLVLAALLTAAAWWPASQLSFDRSIESMFAPDDPLLQPFSQLKRTFGGDQIVLVAYPDDKLMTGPGLERVSALDAALTEVPGVEAVISVDDLTLKRGPLQVSILNNLAEPLRKFFERLLLGENRETTALLCFLRPDLPTGSAPASIEQPTRAEVVGKIRSVAQELQPQAVVAGEPVMVVDGFQYLEQDGETLGWATTILLSLTILITFRSLRWTLIPLVVVQGTLLWTKAVLVLGGFQLSMVSSMLTAIVTVIGIATVIHLIVRYREFRSGKQPPTVALVAASTVLIAPIFWACVTDAIGFSALTVSRVGPVQSFGIMMALGALLTFVSVWVWVPGLAMLGGVDLDPKQAWGEARLTGGLQRLAESLDRRPLAWGLGSLLVIVACAAGYPGLRVETDFTKNFRSETPIVQSYQFIENRLGGAGVWDVYVPAPEQLDEEFFEKIRQFETRLRDDVQITAATGEKQPGLTKVVSLVDALDAMNEVVPLGRGLALFGGQTNAIEQQLRIFRGQVPSLYNALLGTDPQTGQRYYRIMLRAREQQPTEQKLSIIRQVREITQEEFPEGHVTGFFVLLASLVDSLLADQWRTFLVASLGIALAMGLIFRGFAITLVALVPNMLPIFVVLGVMGHLGYRINMGTVMIAAVSVGLSVDSSIHYLTRFRRTLGPDVPFLDALHQVHQSVGRALVFSTLALIVGFLSLVSSNFVPTVYFGVLAAAAMLGGLLGNLILLPLLLKLIRRFVKPSHAPVVPQAEPEELELTEAS